MGDSNSRKVCKSEDTENLQIYKLNLLNQLELSSSKQEIIRKELEDSMSIHHVFTLAGLKLEQKLEKLFSENSELESQREQFKEQTLKNSDRMKVLKKNIQTNIKCKLDKNEGAFQISEDIALRKEKIQDLEEALILGRQSLEDHIDGLKKNYEERILKVKISAKVAKFIETLKYRSVSSFAKTDSLVQKDRFDYDLNIISENYINYDEILKHKIANLRPVKTEPTNNVIENVVIWEKLLRFFMLFIIGFLIISIMS